MQIKDIYEFGNFQVDYGRRSLTRSGEPVPLPGKALDVLHVLLQDAGQTVPKDRLMKEVWPDTFVEEGNLTQMIFLLRKALGETDEGQTLIATVPRQGYRFTGEVTGHSQTPHGREQVDPKVATHPRTRKLLWIAAAISIISGLGGWLLAPHRILESDMKPHLIRYTITPEKGTTYTVGKISPDGRSLALMGTDAAGKSRLWVRRLDALAAQPLASAEFFPFWSPDSRFIAFEQDGKLKKIEVAGGEVQTICNAALVVGGSWNRAGKVIFSSGTALFQVEAKGGEAQPLTRLDNSRGETTHEFPVFLPDAIHFVYTIHSRKKETSGIYLGSLGSPDARVRLVDTVSNAEYAPAAAAKPGYLLFVRGDLLMAQRFAAGDLQLRSEPFPAPLGKIARDPSNLSASFSASENGILLVAPPYQGDQVTWFDRTGKRLAILGKPGLHFSPQLSPNEQVVSVDEMEPERFLTDIWLLPVVPGTASRFTFDGLIRPLWSPDGKRLSFESMNTSLYTKTSAGTESEVLLLKGTSSEDDYRLPCEWSKDGRFLIYAQRDDKAGYDLWRLPLFGDRKPEAFLHSEYNEWCGTLSPDGRWIAYASDESGKSEIYVQAFTDSESSAGSRRKWQISDTGGIWPKWRGDGKEILYLGADRRIIGVAVTAGSGFRHDSPQPLFASGIRSPDARFDVTKDGTRFLVPSAVAPTASEPVTVIVNWTDGIRP